VRPRGFDAAQLSVHRRERAVRVGQVGAGGSRDGGGGPCGRVLRPDRPQVRQGVGGPGLRGEFGAGRVQRDARAVDEMGQPVPGHGVVAFAGDVDARDGDAQVGGVVAAGFDPPLFGPIRETVPFSIRIADVATGMGKEIWRADKGRGSVFHQLVGPDLIWTGPEKGDVLIFVAFGAGLTWANAVVRV